MAEHKLRRRVPTLWIVLALTWSVITGGTVVAGYTFVTALAGFLAGAFAMLAAVIWERPR